MITCLTCGWEQAQAVLTCQGCGAALAPAGPGDTAPSERGDPAMVPARSIPVRVAAAPSRQQVPTPETGPTVLSPPAAGQRLCPDCRRPVSGERRFCRCGGAVDTGEPDRAVTAPARSRSWWAEWDDHRRFRRELRAAGGAPPVSYDAPVSARTRVARWSGALLLAALVVSQLGPWGSDLRREIVADARELQRVLVP